jgi:hypothetical protein
MTPFSPQTKVSTPLSPYLAGQATSAWARDYVAVDEIGKGATMPSHDTMRRLALARYLHGRGTEDGRKGDLLSGLALLPLHDAVELFLRAAAEERGVPLPKTIDFLAYWTAFETAGVPLPLKARMDRFNRARVEAKHRGTLPSQHEVAGFQATVTEFLTIASRELFGLEFEEISMSRLVRSEKVRSELEEAERAFRAGGSETALRHAALAFHRAMNNFKYGDPPGTWDKRLYDPARYDGFSFHDAFGDSVVRRVKDAFEQIGDALTVVAYNLDYDGYRHLLTFGPVVHDTQNPEPFVQWMVEPTKDANTIDRCIQFAIDAALRLENAASRAAV